MGVGVQCSEIDEEFVNFLWSNWVENERVEDNLSRQ